MKPTERQEFSELTHYGKRYVEELTSALQKLPWDAIEEAFRIMASAACSGKRIFLIGNGGGAATALHSACDLLKVSRLQKSFRFRPHAIGGNTALLTALANDLGFERAFLEELNALLEPGDICVFFSTSGRSENVVQAARYAREKGCKVIAICGNGGYLAPLCDVLIALPSAHTGRLEDLQLVVAHILAYHFIENSQSCHQDF